MDASGNGVLYALSYRDFVWFPTSKRRGITLAGVIKTKKNHALRYVHCRRKFNIYSAGSGPTVVVTVRDFRDRNAPEDDRVRLVLVANSETRKCVLFVSSFNEIARLRGLAVHVYIYIYMLPYFTKHFVLHVFLFFLTRSRSVIAIAVI